MSKENPRQISKKARFAGGVSILALATAACEPLFTGEQPTPSPTEPFVTQPVEIPLSTVEPEPTATPLSAIVGRPYPTSDSGLLIGVGGMENAEERIRELGAGEDIEKMRGMYIAEMNRSGINPESVEWVFAINELAESPSWTMMPRDRNTGRLRWVKLTEGPEAGQLERSGNLARYLTREFGDDFFDFVELQDPPGLGQGNQQPVSDMSGWWPAGAFAPNGEFRAWYSAEEDDWFLASSFLPEGAVKGQFQDGQWVALDSQGEVGWRFDQESDEWEEAGLDILQLLAEQNILFPEDTTSEFQDENLSFNIRYSEGILRGTGLNYVQFPSHVKERWGYQIAGIIGLFQMYNFPDYYSDFEQFANEIKEAKELSGNIHTLDGTVILMDTSRRLLDEKGPMPIKLNSANVSGEISGLNLNFVTKEEFERTIQLLEKEDVNYAREAEWLHELSFPNGEFGMSVFIKGNTLEVLAYNQYIDKAYLAPRNTQMPELAASGQSRTYYYKSVNNIIYWTTVFLESVVESEPYDPAMGNVFINYTTFICGEDPGAPSDLFKRECTDEANETFSPLYAPTPTPSPTP